jgi:histone demethylase JARID1
MKHCSADRRDAFECAGCDLVFHRHCISPAFQQPVEGEWLCATCLKFGEDCSFIEGKEYSLAEFGTLADDFKRAWFEIEGQSPMSTKVAEAACEKEFWRIVSSPYETVEVEYGADLHTSKVGRCVYLTVILTSAAGFPYRIANPNTANAIGT